MNRIESTSEPSVADVAHVTHLSRRVRAQRGATAVIDLARTASVPCGSCTACCKGAVPVRPEWGDKTEEYETESALDPRSGLPVLILRRGADGTCVYLKEDGCSIYERRPAVCRSFDCRAFYRATQAVWRWMNGSGKPPLPAALFRVFEAGKGRSSGASDGL